MSRSPTIISFIPSRLFLLLLLGVSVAACDGLIEDDTEPSAEFEVKESALTWITQSSAFSQRDPRWADIQLANGQLRIGTHGCAMTSATMAAASRGLQTDPKKMNAWLKANGGYTSKSEIIWPKVADADGAGGLIWVGFGTLPTTAAQLKSLLDARRLIVARSSRFGEHWVAIIGYAGNGSRMTDFVYFDPYDRHDLACVERRVGDGWVSGGNPTRIYRF